MITTLDTPLYPDYLDEAKIVFEPVIKKFGELLEESTDSVNLYKTILTQPTKVRVQLLRVFRRYVFMGESVEATKIISASNEIIRHHGAKFRPLEQVREKFYQRPTDDETLVAVLQEQANRGQKGYNLTQIFFEWFENQFSGTFTLVGPRGAGADIDLKRMLSGFSERAPTDFVICSLQNEVLAVGYARYDSDRGGTQEYDRTGGNQDKITIVERYNRETASHIKLIFLNDGPGLALGSMWRYYASMEQGRPHVLVVTLKMLEERLTAEWLNS